MLFQVSRFALCIAVSASFCFSARFCFSSSVFSFWSLSQAIFRFLILSSTFSFHHGISLGRRPLGTLFFAARKMPSVRVPFCCLIVAFLKYLLPMNLLMEALKILLFLFIQRPTSLPVYLFAISHLDGWYQYMVVCCGRVSAFQMQRRAWWGSTAVISIADGLNSTFLLERVAEPSLRTSNPLSSKLSSSTTSPYREGSFRIRGSQVPTVLTSPRSMASVGMASTHSGSL